MDGKKIKVAIYEDNASLLDSLSKLVSTFPGFELTGAYANAVNILQHTAHSTPDVILMDIDMPGISGIEAVGLVYKNFPEVKVLMQTVFDDNDKVFNSICAGAVGYLLKKTPPLQILEAIKEAMQGGAPITPSVAVKILHMFKEQAPIEKKEEYHLSDREKEILLHLTKGMSYKMIAAECNVSIDTVRFHIKNIYEKLHVNSSTEAVSKALRQKIV